MKYTVAFIYGGESAEHDVSLVGAKNVSSKIDRSKYEVISVFISKNGEWFIESAEKRQPTFPAFINGEGGLFLDGKITRIDVALPLLHGELGEDGIITGALRAAHIKYVGCDVLASAASADKIVTKSIAESLDIPTAKWLFSGADDPSLIVKEAESRLGYPIFVKPATLGSSIGISRAENREQFYESYAKARSLSKRVLIEEAVKVKCELECAYLACGGERYFRVGCVFSNGCFYDFDKKYIANTRTDAELSDRTVEKAVIEYSDRLQRILDARQISRFDFFLTEESEILFNEINTMPGMTKTSLYPRLAEKMGFADGEFINRLLSEALL